MAKGRDIENHCHRLRGLSFMRLLICFFNKDAGQGPEYRGGGQYACARQVFLHCTQVPMPAGALET